jgi:hypothetical protein
MTSIDTNISNYTLSELLTIVDINDDELEKLLFQKRISISINLKLKTLNLLIFLEK